MKLNNKDLESGELFATNMLIGITLQFWTDFQNPGWTWRQLIDNVKEFKKFPEISGKIEINFSKFPEKFEHTTLTVMCHPMIGSIPRAFRIH